MKHIYTTLTNRIQVATYVPQELQYDKNDFCDADVTLPVYHSTGQNDANSDINGIAS